MTGLVIDFFAGGGGASLVLPPPEAVQARALVEDIRTAEHDAYARTKWRLTQVQDQAAIWIGTTRETRAMRARFEPIYREELERRRGVVAWKVRKFARTLRNRGLLPAMPAAIAALPGGA